MDPWCVSDATSLEYQVLHDFALKSFIWVCCCYQQEILVYQGISLTFNPGLPRFSLQFRSFVEGIILWKSYVEPVACCNFPCLNFQLQSSRLSPIKFLGSIVCLLLQYFAAIEAIFRTLFHILVVSALDGHCIGLAEGTTLSESVLRCVLECVFGYRNSSTCVPFLRSLLSLLLNAVGMYMLTMYVRAMWCICWDQLFDCFGDSSFLNLNSVNMWEQVETFNPGLSSLRQ